MKTLWIKLTDDKSTWPNDSESVLLLLNDKRILDATVNRPGDDFYFNDWYGDDIEPYEVDSYLYLKDILP
jgi:hypothetical protein